VELICAANELKLECVNSALNEVHFFVEMKECLDAQVFVIIRSEEEKNF